MLLRICDRNVRRVDALTYIVFRHGVFALTRFRKSDTVSQNTRIICRTVLVLTCTLAPTPFLSAHVSTTRPACFTIQYQQRHRIGVKYSLHMCQKSILCQHYSHTVSTRLRSPVRYIHYLSGSAPSLPTLSHANPPENSQRERKRGDLYPLSNCTASPSTLALCGYR